MLKNAEKCPYCKSDNIGVGYQLGDGRIFADEYAIRTARDCSAVEYLICKDCGSILHARVIHPEVFHPINKVRQEELLDFIEEHGILLCNEDSKLPSLASLGYDMENMMGLIDLHQVFYCKAYRKRSTYLSQKAYFLLKRCKMYPEMDADSKKVYHAVHVKEAVEKDDLKAFLNMDNKTFEKSFQFLLENLYLTAFGRGKRLNANWYTYLYCTTERWEKEAHGLHFSGDAEKALSDLLCRVGGMDEKELIRMIK